MRYYFSLAGSILAASLAWGGCDCGLEGEAMDAPTDLVFDDAGHPGDVEVEGEDIEVEPPCDGLPVTTSGILDLDIKAVRVTGRVTLGGVDLPDEAFSRGEIVLTEKESEKSLSIPLGSAGSFTYAVTVSPGLYAVRFRPDTTGCGESSPRLMPCVGGIILDDLPLIGDGVLDIDIRAVRVTGNVTVNGGSLPDQAGSRGEILFVETQGEESAPISLGSARPVFYDILIMAGTYDILYAANPGLCNGTASPGVPCTGGVLREGLAILSDGALDLDIPAVSLGGACTLGGAALPDEPPSRGDIAFARGEDGDALSFPLGGSGPMYYALTLFPGTYDVSYIAPAGHCTGAVFTAMPCTGGALIEGVPVTTSGALDLDVGAVHVSGNVLLRGTPLPAEAGPRGEISFGVAGGGEGVAFPLNASGPITYQLTLFPGTYDAAFSANPDLCAGGAAAQMPCTGGDLVAGVLLATDGVLDLDIGAVSVGGAVLLDGLQLPDESMSRGTITFSKSDAGGSLDLDLGAAGPKTYHVVLFPGSYDVEYEPNPTLCGSGTPRMPCIGSLLHEELPLTADGVLDLNILSAGVGKVRVTGRVTLNGTDLPDEALSRGDILFEPTGEGEGETVPLGTSGPVVYDIRMSAGTYDIAFSGNGGLCGLGTMPCNGGAILEEIPLTVDGVLDVNIESAVVSGAVTVNGMQAADEPVDRGAILFSLNWGQGATTPPFGTAGPVSYSLALMKGYYIVYYAANPALCTPGRAPSFPCMDQILLGCE